MKKNESLELIKEMTKQPPPRTERKTFRQALIDMLYQMAHNEEQMQELKEKNSKDKSTKIKTKMFFIVIGRLLSLKAFITL